MNDIQKLMEYITPFWEKRFAEKQNQIQEFFQKHQAEISKDFCNCIIHNLLPDVINIPPKEEQEETSFFCISYLHSSLVVRSYEYEISLFGQLLFADENRKSVYWRPQFLYQNIEEDEIFLQEELRRKFIRVEYYEIEVLRRFFFSQYWNVAPKYFKVLADELLREQEVKKWIRDRQIVILYGEHMGELEEIA